MTILENLYKKVKKKYSIPRASVHIKLPLLAAGGHEALQNVADKYKLQVRNTGNPRLGTELMDCATAGMRCEFFLYPITYLF